jgi:epoxyqueuosine reductase QueG
MNIREMAKEFGFAETFVFSTEPFTHYKRRLTDGALHHAGTDLTADVRAKEPWANAILALILPYRPYPDSVPVSGNYPSSNKAYHVANKLMRALNEQGIHAKRAYVPIRELLIRNGVGVPLKNGLTYIPNYGTRYSVQTLLIDLPEVEFSPVQTQEEPFCAKCHACQKVCPSSAISDSGYDYKTCARAFMGGEPMEDWVMDAMTSILGCELCQSICPYNREIEPVPDVPEAFALEKLLSGDVKPALEIVGTNLNKHGRLIQHACVMAAKQGRKDLLPLIEKLLEDQREGVRVAAAYAKKTLS